MVDLLILYAPKNNSRRAQDMLLLIAIEDECLGALAPILFY
jgi:hypothetical protein